MRKHYSNIHVDFYSFFHHWNFFSNNQIIYFLVGMMTSIDLFLLFPQMILLPFFPVTTSPPFPHPPFPPTMVSPFPAMTRPPPPHPPPHPPSPRMMVSPFPLTDIERRETRAKTRIILVDKVDFMVCKVVERSEKVRIWMFNMVVRF